MGSILRIIIFLAASGALIYFTAGKLYNLPPSGVNADNGTYFFDNLFERIKLAMLREPDSKLQKIMEFSQEKINEMKDLEDKNKSVLLEKVYQQNNYYASEAIKQIEKIKEKGGNAAEWEKKISEQILAQKEVLTAAQNAAPVEAKTIIEKGIAIAEQISNSIIEKASEPVKEVIVYQIHRVNAAIEDKRDEDKIEREKEEKILLSEPEKIYNLWIESLYAKTLSKAGEPFFMRAHLRRRDNECKFFNGEFILSFNDKILKNQIINMPPSDDLWLDIGPILMEKGSFEFVGKLIDKQSREISIKNLKILVD